MPSTKELAIRSVADLTQVGEHFERSGLFGCSEKGQGLVLAMTCVQQGISPIEFSQTYHIIDGRLSMKADAMLAKFTQNGGRFTVIERSKTRAAARFICEDNDIEAEYTMEDAEQSKVCFKKDGKTLKTNWAQFPKQMLWARLISDTIRTIMPSVNFGAYTPEEIRDLDELPRTARAADDVPAAGKRLSPDEAADRVKATFGKPDSAQENAPDNVHEPEVLAPEYDTMPIGKNKGRKWEEFSDKNLTAALDCGHPAITEKHLERIRAILADRKANNTQEKE